MSKDRSVAVYVQDMLECIERAQDYCAGVTAGEFEANIMLQDAVFRRVEIFGEAAKHVPSALRTRHPDIPWQRIAGLRDVLIHKYFGIIVEQVWQVATTEMPALKSRLLQVHADAEEAELEPSE